VQNRFDLEEWMNLGNLLVREGSLTSGQLSRALDEQERRKSSLLGDLLVELRLCTREEVESALRHKEVLSIPETPKEVRDAQFMLQEAFAKVSKEADRLTEKRSESNMRIKISPDD